MRHLHFFSENVAESWPHQNTVLIMFSKDFIVRVIVWIRKIWDFVYQTNNFGINQIESMCRQEIFFVFDRVEKFCGERRNCWLSAFLPTMFLKAFAHMVLKLWIVWLRVRISLRKENTTGKRVVTSNFFFNPLPHNTNI